VFVEANVFVDIDKDHWEHGLAILIASLQQHGHFGRQVLLCGFRANEYLAS
jgi:hypothetical protein